MPTTPLSHRSWSGKSPDERPPWLSSLPHGNQGGTGCLEDQKLSSLLEAQAKEFSDHWNGFRSGICEYSFLDRDNALSSNVICNSSALAVTQAVRSAAAATRQVFQTEDFLQWTLLGTKGPFVFTPEPLTRYRVHAESASYLDSGSI